MLVPAISPLAAQTFDLQILSNGNAFDAANGSTIPFQAQSIGSDNQIFVAAVYLGSQSATILHTDLLGPSDFSVQGAGTPTLRTGDSYSFSVHYRASSSAFEQALLTVTYQEATIPTPQVSTFRLTLTGAAPQIAVSYELATDKSFRPVTTGSEIDLPATPPGTPVLATITVANVGSGPGVIRSASINGSSFDLVGLPFLPATLAAGQNLTFSVRSSPSSPGAYTATLEIDGPNGHLLRHRNKCLRDADLCVGRGRVSGSGFSRRHDCLRGRAGGRPVFASLAGIESNWPTILGRRPQPHGELRFSVHRRHPAPLHAGIRRHLRRGTHLLSVTRPGIDFYPESRKR